jgi:general secretion pathway protein J
MKSSPGFTLIELLIALCIFAILASITASSLFNAFHTAAHLTKQADQLNEIQLALSILQQDNIQVTPRPVRGDQMRLFPAIIGHKDYYEITRTGNTNPNSAEKRSTLKRIAFLCQKGHLIRRTWASLDVIQRAQHEDKLLLSDLSECYFSYLNQHLQSFPEWLPQEKEIFPKAVKLHLTIKNLGSMELLYPLPQTRYDSQNKKPR